MAVSTSPRKKQPIAAERGPGLVGARHVECSSPRYRDEEEEDDELPELATLLGETTLTDGKLRKGKEQSERVSSSDKREQGVLPEKLYKPSTSRKGTRTEQPAENGGNVFRPRPTNMPPRHSSSSLSLGATPSLLPSVSTTPKITETSTTTTTSRSSRQTIQQPRGPPVRQKRNLSPTKRSINTLPQNGKDETAYSGPESLISGSRAVSRGPVKTSISGSIDRRSRSLKPQPVTSLLLPLSSLALDSKENHNGISSTEDNSAEEDIFQCKPSKRKCKLTSQTGRVPDISTSNRSARARAAMFVLKEAACKDDDGEDDEELESKDDFTDLSGFIVGDDEEISFQESDPGSRSDSDSDSGRLTRKKRSPIKKGLMPGTDQGREEPKQDLNSALRSLSLEDAEKSDSEARKRADGCESLANAISGMCLGDRDREQTKSSRSRRTELEVIDLTSSPVKPQLAPEVQQQNDKMPKRRRPLEPLDQQQPPPLRRRQQDRFTCSGSDENAVNDVDDEAILRFSPPPRNISPFRIKSKSDSTLLHSNEKPNSDHKALTTPPQTPPASPSKPKSPTKLNSPSKKNPLLLSPSKRGVQIPQSPHRQSIDAFWSSEVINEWNDAYSPAKPPLTLSPRKRWNILEENESGSESGNESPSESPARRRREGGKSPAKTAARTPAKKAATEEKKAMQARKREFDAKKEKLAHDLLKELDEQVTHGQLARLSRSTGGVKISWSKNLRSTAGRANWRRTVVTRASLDATPAAAAATVGGEKGGAGGGDGKKEVQHHASIELAEKIIDDEERLVNTLAHEFCHLANFMVSGIRDRPHGAEFKAW